MSTGLRLLYQVKI